MTKFLLGLLVAASKNPEIQKFVADQLATVAKRLKDDLLPDIAGMFPAFGAALVKEVFEKVPGLNDIQQSVGELATGAMEQLQRDPDVPGLSNVLDVSEMARKWLHQFGI